MLFFLYFKGGGCIPTCKSSQDGVCPRVSRLKGDIKGPFKSSIIKDTFSQITNRRYYHNTLLIKKVLTFSSLSPSLIQAIA